MMPLIGNRNAEILQALKDSARATDNLTTEITKLDDFMKDQTRKVQDLTAASGGAGVLNTLVTGQRATTDTSQYRAGGIASSASTQEKVREAFTVTSGQLPANTQQTIQPSEPPQPPSTQTIGQGPSAYTYQPGALTSSASTPQAAATRAKDEGAFSAQDIIALDLLGADAPGFLKQVATKQYGLQRTARWGQDVVSGLGGTLQTMSQSDSRVTSGIAGALSTVGINSGTMETISNTMSKVNNDKVMGVAAGAILANNWLQGKAAEGYQFGYGGSSSPGFFGFRNPANAISTAAAIGWGETNIEQTLMGRNPFGGRLGLGLNSALAQQTVATIANQGFAPAGAGGGGDMGMLTKNLYGPVLTNAPGLNPQELSLMLPAVRYGTTSIGALREEIGNLGSQARATRMDVNTYTSSLAQSAQVLTALGSSPGSSLGAGADLSRLGLPPQLTDVANNSIFQGLALSQYGVLPSALGEMNPGAFASTVQRAVGMVGGATTGFAQNVWTLPNGQQRIGGNRPPVPGAVLSVSGQHQHIAQIASMTGVPYNVVHEYMTHPRQFQAGSNILRTMGSIASGTGITSLLNQNTAQSRAQAATDYRLDIAPQLNTLAQTGLLSPSQLHHLQQMPLKARVQALMGTAHHAGMLSDLFKKITGPKAGPGPNDVAITLKGQAKNMFSLQAWGQKGPSVWKRMANAGANPSNPFGGNQTNSIFGSPTGDISGPANPFSTSATTDNSWLSGGQ